MTDNLLQTTASRQLPYYVQLLKHCCLYHNPHRPKYDAKSQISQVADQLHILYQRRTHLQELAPIEVVSGMYTVVPKLRADLSRGLLYIIILWLWKNALLK